MIGILWAVLAVALFAWAMYRDDIRFTSMLIIILGAMFNNWAFTEFGW